jgi:hypothetical protein
MVTMSWKALTVIHLNIDSDESYSTGRFCDIDCLRDDDVLDVFAIAINCFESDTIACSIHTIWLKFQDLGHRITILEVDWNGTNAFCFRESFGNLVYTIDFDGSTKNCRIRAEQADRTCEQVSNTMNERYQLEYQRTSSKNNYGISRDLACTFQCIPSRGLNVC